MARRTEAEHRGISRQVASLLHGIDAGLCVHVRAAACDELTIIAGPQPAGEAPRVGDALILLNYDDARTASEAIVDVRERLREIWTALRRPSRQA